MPAAERRPSDLSAGRALLISLRPYQWTKNLIVFAGLIFGQRLLDADAVARSGAAFVVFCILGGYLSDHFGRRLTLALFGLGTLIPTLWIGWRLHAEGWLHPVEGNADGIWPRHEALISAWWILQPSVSITLLKTRLDSRLVTANRSPSVTVTARTANSVSAPPM